MFNIKSRTIKKMKRSKFILSALLAGYLVATSCTETRDPSKNIVYSFKPEVIFPETTTSGRNQILHIKLASDVYKDGVLDHEVTYIDDQKSYLLFPKGDTINPGQTFSIPHIDRSETFNFYSESLGDHNLEFIFKNSKGFTVTEERKVVVEKATFKFNVKKSEQELTMDTPMVVEYFIDPYDRLNHSYKIKFEVEGNYNATLNGHESDEWFDVFDMSGKLTYIPLTVGTHKVRVTSKNDENTKKVDYFTIVSKGPGIPVLKSFSIDPIIIGGVKYKKWVYDGPERGWNSRLKEHRVEEINYKLSAHPGNDKEYLKTKLKLLALENLEETFEPMKEYAENQRFGFLRLLGAEGACIKRLPDEFFLTDGQHIDYILELENSDGKKTIHKGVVPIKLRYKKE